MAYMINFSEVEPSNNAVGKVWIKPSIGQAFMYLNGHWNPFASGDSYSFSYPLTIFIRGVDRTSVCEIESCQKTDIITNQVDTFSFKLYDKNADIQPTQGEEIIVFRKTSESAIPTKWFGGEIEKATPTENAPGQRKFTYQIECVDYSKRAGKPLINEVYENDTELEIITHMCDNYATEFSYSNVLTTLTIDKRTYNRKSFRECLEDLAQLNGKDWYIDYERDIHYFSQEINVAPYSLTEDITTTGHYKDLSIEVDKSQLRNDVMVYGGVYLSDTYTQEKLADGVQLSFALDYNPRGTVKVYVDSGGGYVEHTLGIDNIDTSGRDFVLNYNEKLIKNLDHALLANTDKIKFTYQYEIQVLTEDKDRGSIAAIQDIEGGDGIYKYIIVDETLETLDAAHNRGIAELADYVNPLITGSFTTDQGGYRSGQLLTINLPTWRYTNRQFLIQEVITTLREDGTTFEYQITFATKLKGLTDFLVELYDKGKVITDDENVTLHDLEQLADETLTLSDETPTLLEQTPPFQFGPGGSPQGIYNESQYG